MRCKMWTLIVFSLVISDVDSLKEEVPLFEHLLKQYKPTSRPVLAQNNTINVTMDLALNQLRDLNEPDQYLLVVVWFRYWWIDEHLTWDPNEWSNITELRFHRDEIWKPDIMIYNHADEERHSAEVLGEYFINVYSNGSVYWPVPAMIKTTCKVDVTYYPFDTQRCPIKFGSWSYHGFHLDLHPKNDTGDLTNFISHGEWKILEFPAVRTSLLYGCCDEPYIDVTYTVVMQRKPMFYIFNLMLPCVLLMGVAMLVFYLPSESGEKVSLAVTLLLSMTVFLLVIAENMPPTSDVIPLIGQFFGATIVILGLSTVLTVIQLNIHFNGEHGLKVPTAVRKIVLVYMAKPVGMRRLVAFHLERLKAYDEVDEDIRQSICDLQGPDIMQLYNTRTKVQKIESLSGMVLGSLGVNSLKEEMPLFHHLLKEYKATSRPVLAQTTAINVTMDLALNQLRDLNEPDQYLMAGVWFRYWWIDEHLTWDPEEWSNITELRFLKDEIWNPDILIFNHADEERLASEVLGNYTIYVYSDGRAFWPVPAMIKTTCKVDVTYYPFDTQRCPIKFGSGSYHEFHLDIYPKSCTGDIKSFVNHGEWKILEMPAIRKSLNKEPYVEVTYTVVMRRKPMFYILNLMLPCIVLVGMALLVFYLPPESQEKVSLSGTLLLSMTVFLLVIAENMPPTSDVIPLIGLFFGASIVIVGLSTILTVMQLNIHFYGVHGLKVPSAVRKIVLVYMAKPVGMRRLVAFHLERLKAYDAVDEDIRQSICDLQGPDIMQLYSTRTKVQRIESLSGNSSPLPMSTLGTTSRTLSPSFGSVSPRSSGDNRYGARSPFEPSMQNNVVTGQTNSILLDILRNMEEMNNFLSNEKEEKETRGLHKHEWQLVAMVTDRYMLIGMVVLTLVTILVIFLGPRDYSKGIYWEEITS
ncbi:unnamed protein product [Owenia fusiformis]|uniref:Uncharacterized protein n=1 Tax=Owenia fusiformis TaxID=6347 RepID=A0A8J1YBR3_OWEFU|nr:unnamed protein product [Owenia fusiformis]